MTKSSKDLAIIIIPHLPSLYGRRYNIAKILAQRGNKVHFVIWDMPYPLTVKSAFKHLLTSWRRQEYQHSGFTVHKVGRLPFFWPIVNGVLFKRQIRKIYKNNDIDVIFSQSYTNETESPVDLPLIYDMNDDHAAFAEVYGSVFYKIGFELLQVKKVVKSQIVRAQLVTYVSDALGKMAEPLNKNSLFLPNGVDELAFTVPIKTKSTKGIKLTYISNFGPWSKLSEVVSAINVLRKKYPSIILNVVGEGTELSKAIELANQLNLTANVKIHGHVSDRKKIFAIIDDSDLCINISEKNKFRDAAFPIKVLEYSARGQKVISSDLNEVRALKFENVFISKNPSTGELLAIDIEKILSKSFDGENISHKIAQEYRWNTIAIQLESAIHAVQRKGYVR